MTGLDTRPVVRETRDIDRERGKPRPIVIRLEEGGRLIRLKRKGERRWHTVTYAAVLLFARKISAEDARRQKRLARLERQRERTRS